MAAAVAQVPLLLVHGGMPSVMEFVKQLPEETLIDVVLSRMPFLPRECPAESVTIEQCLATQRAICAALVNGAAAPAAAARTGTPPATPPSRPPSAPAVKGEPSPPPAPAPPRARPKVRAAPLRPAEAAQMQGAVIRRILAAPPTLNPGLRLRAVAKLAPAANTPEGQELLRGFRSLLASDMDAALELVILWLYTLFLRQCCKLPDPATPGADLPISAAAQAAGIDAAAIYLSALESVFQTLADTSSPTDRLATGERLPPLTKLISEVPLLPEGIVKRRLEHLFSISAAWGRVALATMRKLIQSKHALKPVMLSVAIQQMLHMRDPELQHAAMRMLTNQVRVRPLLPLPRRLNALKPPLRGMKDVQVPFVACLQVYLQLQPDEATALEDAAVKLVADFANEKAEPPADADELAAYNAQNARKAQTACQLFEMLCVKNARLLRRYWAVFLEETQDDDVKVPPATCCAPAPCFALACCEGCAFPSPFAEAHGCRASAGGDSGECGAHRPRPLC